MIRKIMTGLTAVLCVFILLGTMPIFAGQEGYTLDKVVILSRHNIRSPLGRSGSAVGDLTDHEWFEWTSEPGELSRRGAILETIMGQYFRLCMENEGLFPLNYIPDEGVVRFYANAKQRTIATAHYFSAGLLPVANVEIETHAEYDQHDPVFHSAVWFTSEEYEKAVMDEISSMSGGNGLDGIHAQLEDAIRILMEVTDTEDTEAYQSGQYKDQLSPEATLTFEVGNEPELTGVIRTAVSLADALTMQYYEEKDSYKAAFGEKLTWEDWLKIHSIVDTYQNMLFGTKLLALNEGHLILQELRSEMGNMDRKFSYLCGHDSNMNCVLSAIGADSYELPGTMETVTPIGGKIVFQRWLSDEGEAYYTADLVYMSIDQIHDMTMVSPEEPPMTVPLSFSGAQANEDGMIPEQELLALFDNAISAYDEIRSEYGAKEETSTETLKEAVPETGSEADSETTGETASEAVPANENVSVETETDLAA